MDLYLHMSSLCTLVSEGCSCVFYARRYQVCCGLTPNVVFGYYSNLIERTIHKQRHTAISEANRLTHSYEYVLLAPVVYSQQLYVLH